MVLLGDKLHVEDFLTNYITGFDLQDLYTQQ